jgi:hypothetical protein
MTLLRGSRRCDPTNLSSGKTRMGALGDAPRRRRGGRAQGRGKGKGRA